MNPSSLIRHRRDLFVASRNPFAARWSTLSPSPLPVTHAQIAITSLAGPDDDRPEGQFPDAPDTLTDTERPGAPQNRHGDRGGVS